MNLLFSNLTFEDELRQPGFQPTTATQRALNELAPLMGLLAGSSDSVVVPEIPEPTDLPDCLQRVNYCTLQQLNHHSSFRGPSTAGLSSQPAPHLLPWGWTPAARQLAARIGMPDHCIPRATAVAHVNSRKFAAALDPVRSTDATSLPFGLQQFGQICENLDAWSVAVQRLEEAGYSRWVAKPQFSHAGRNRLLGTGRELNSQQLGWLTRQLSQPGGIYMEPWVCLSDEAGLQFQIDAPTEGGRIRLIGVTRLLNDSAGRYAGSIVVPDDLLEIEWQLAVEHGFEVCRAAKLAGYFGPLGIDAFRYLTASGGAAMRLCNDINARLTMGRVALELRRWLQPGESAAWCQLAGLSSPQKWAEIQKIPADPAFSGVRLVGTSPSRVAGTPVRLRTLLVAGLALERVQEVAEMLRSGLPGTADNNTTA